MYSWLITGRLQVKFYRYFKNIYLCHNIPRAVTVWSISRRSFEISVYTAFFSCIKVSHVGLENVKALSGQADDERVDNTQSWLPARSISHLEQFQQFFLIVLLYPSEPLNCKIMPAIAAGLM